MADDDDTRVERVTPKQTLLNLMKMQQTTNSRIAAERGALGVKIKQAEEKQFLDTWAFRIVAQLNAMDGGVAARHFRQLMIYAEHAGIGDQADLEDAIDEAAKTPEAATAGKGKAKGKGKAAKDKEEGFDAGGAPKPTGLTPAEEKRVIAEFNGKIAGLGKRAIARELQSYVKNYPGLAGTLEGLAAERSGTDSPATAMAGERGISQDTQTAGAA